MTSKKFVTLLETLAPTKEFLIKCGYENDEANEFRRSFICEPRKELLHLVTNDDALLELLNTWDTSKVEIGNLSFIGKPVFQSDFLEIALIEIDRLVYRKKEKDFILIDGHDCGRTICAVAKNGDALLEALYQVAKYYSQTATGQIDIDDTAIALQIKSDCMQILGGDEFSTFCTTLLGV